MKFIEGEMEFKEYLYPKKVDCIYIDPPYNTGARDWKYDNDYADSTDEDGADRGFTGR
jgi:16S rRNA G966 N2-methylase RsmD